MRRGLAEQNFNFKQPIAYSIIVNPELKQIFSYQRSQKDENYVEKRLQGKWSWGVGGHIEKFDSSGNNPIHTSMLREINEEVYINSFLKPKVLGYLNYDSDDVGKVHLGILYIVETNSKIVTPKDPEIAHGMLRPFAELEELCVSPDYNVESWSKIALEPLKEYFN